MAVEAGQPDVRGLEGLLRDLEGLPRLDGDAELGVHPAGVHRLVGVGVDARRDAQKDVLGDAVFPGHAADAAQLLEIVHDEAGDARLDAHAYLPQGLGAAVEVEPVRGKARLERGVQLPGGDNVRADALIVRDAVDLLEAQGLAGHQGHAARGEVFFHRVGVAAHIPAQQGLVHDVEGRAELLRQGHGVHPGHGEVPGGVYGVIVL